MSNTLVQRIAALKKLMGMFEPVPKEWLEGAKAHKNGEKTAEPLKPLPCTSYKDLINWWKKAMRWRQDMDDVFSVMLAIALSTDRIGDQLFLQVIGDAGGGKTRLCEGMLVSEVCHALEHITGFHSGWKDSSGEDYSLISRINHKCLITPEGDTMMKSPNFAEIMSQQRRIFDGTSGATYKNQKKDVRYTGLRTPWIIVGTQAMLNDGQSQLGDRFLRIFIETPPDEEKQAITKRVGHTALRAVMQTSNGSAEGQLEENICRAYRYTGGYVDWLFSNAEELLNKLQIEADHVVDRCSKLGEFTAKMRARPITGGHKDIEATDEMPTRLTHQFVRLSCCLAATMNRKGIDDEILRRVHKVSMGTSRGQSLEIVTALWRHRKLWQAKKQEDEGLSGNDLAEDVSREEYSTKIMRTFLRKIGVIEWYDLKRPKANGLRKWRLTTKMRKLYGEVMGDA